MYSLPKSYEDGDLAALVDWVHYHDVMTRFTLRHWHGMTVSMRSDPSDCIDEIPILQLPAFPLKRSCTTHKKPSTSALLDLLFEFCDTMQGPPSGAVTSQALEDRKAFLRVLDWRVRTVPLTLGPGEAPEMTTIIELYRLAILVYVDRASEKLLDQAARTQQNIDKAFALFSQLDYCAQQFPIFILGCEARTDDRRATIMDLISRTEKKPSSRSFNHVTLLLQAFWAQNDLAAGGLNYWDTLNSIITHCTIVPSFV